MRILAVIAARNEGDVIYHVVRDLIENGVEVYLIDDGSADNTVAEAGRWLGRGLIHIERIEPSCTPCYVWRELLAMKERLVRELNPDWCIHADADEFREAPWAGMTLAQAIDVVDAAGYNAIDFRLINFRPTDNSFIPGSDVRKSLVWYEEGAACDRIQVKAWKHNCDIPVDLVSSGAHEAQFQGRLVFPIRFLLRHYPLRSLEQMRFKLGPDRHDRFDATERSAGWHVQYDVFGGGEPVLWDPGTLHPFDASAIRLELLDAYTRQPSSFDRYRAHLLEERMRLRNELIAERAEVSRIARAEAERAARLAEVEASLANMKLQCTREILAFSARCAQLLAGGKNRICIWGAGSGGLRALHFLQHLKIRVHAFIDGDPQKIGKSIRRHPVLAPAALGTKPWRRETTGVFVASAARQQIEGHLAAMGWRDSRDYFSIPQIVLDQAGTATRSARA